MYCKKCGSSILNGGSFCPNCGNPVEEGLSSNRKKSNTKNIVIVIAIIVIVLALILILLNFFKDKDKYIGKWETSGGTYFVFNNDGLGFWYKSKGDLDDNYYEGKITALNGDDAVTDLNLTISQINTVINNSKGKVQPENIYSLKFCPYKLIVEGEDKSNTLRKDCIKYVFVSVDEKTAQLGNYNTGDKYYLTKVE